MPNRTSITGSDLFIVDNSDEDWKAARYLHQWCEISKSIDIATGYFEIGALLTLGEQWQKVDKIRILMGDEVSLRTRDAFVKGLEQLKSRLDSSIEAEKQKNDFLAGVPAIVQGLQTGRIECRVYRKDKFHAKAYITHARLDVVGAAALVGSSNFTYPGLTENIELNVQITGRPVTVLQEWFEEHWQQGEDVTAEVLQVIERHVQEYTPFDVYAKALQELLRHHQMSADEWEATDSKVYPILGKYQRDGYHRLMEIASEYQGAFLCDGVGLGKTFVGLMLIERLVLFERKRVCLLVPKSGRKAVWESCIQRYLPHLEGAFGSNLRIINHTDLQRGPGEIDFPKLMEQLKTGAEVFIIDEAHNFRNPGIKGTGLRRQSRYWDLFDLLDGKQVYLLTATPVNNSLLDLQHMIELFSRREADYFFKKNPALGLHSLPGHFRSVERQLFGPAQQQEVLNFFKAEEVLSRDALFNALVVQRSRAYVRKSQEQTPGDKAIFPIREKPQVAVYSLKKTYEKILELIENAFSKEKPLFSLAIYYPLFYYTGPETEDRKWEEGRQEQVVALIRTQFLKRFESSVCSFELSCQRLLLKLLTWVTRHTTSPHQKRRLERWMNQHGKVIGFVQNRQHELFPVEGAEEEDDNLITDEMLADIEELDPTLYKVDEILDETYLDLDQITQFLEELTKFRPSHDDKLKALVRLLKNDPVMKQHKVLIFTEYKDTARYLQRELKNAGITGVDEIDSGSADERIDVIRRFAPYYNGYSSAQLVTEGQTESRILVATDVLSEGLNLQDATRLINYDIHWNPVRLMQRIGRVDRRLNPQTEARILADHPDQQPIREKVAFWNFLPPDELDSLLSLYARVAHKTLQISKTFGIEGSKLLKPDDDYQALRDFNAAYEGEPNTTESLLLEYQKLGVDNPGLEERLSALPGRVFSGKRHPNPGARAIFFCYALPAPPPDNPAAPADQWSQQHGRAEWFLYRLDDQQILGTPAEIVSTIRSQPDTPRVCALAPEMLSDIRAKVEKHLKNSYLKAAQAPAGVKPVLKAWMELC